MTSGAEDIRPNKLLEDVTGSLAVTERELARGELLGKTTAAIEHSLKQSDTKDAYAACSAAPAAVPRPGRQSETEGGPAAGFRSAAGAGEGSCRCGSRPTRARSEGTQPQLLTLAWTGLKTEVPEVAGQTVVTAVDGAVYGLEAASGKVLWRRFVGLDANPQAPSFPHAFSTDRGSDVLVADTATTTCCGWKGARPHPLAAEHRRAVRRLSGDRGREHLGRHPRRQADDRGGGLRRAVGYTDLAQPLARAAGARHPRSLAYQVADHTNVFIMSLDDDTCKNVAYLGHEPGTVLTPPVVVDDFLLVAINGGAHDSTLNVFLISRRNPARPSRGSSRCSRSSSAGTCKRRPTSTAAACC